MSAGIQFDEGWSRRVEAIYTTPDVAAQRRAVLRMLAPQPGKRILDIGCGPGFLVRELAVAVGDSGAVRGMDASEAMLEIARRRCTDLPGTDFLLGDAVRLPYATANSMRRSPSRCSNTSITSLRQSARCSACCGPAGARW